MGEARGAAPGRRTKRVGQADQAGRPDAASTSKPPDGARAQIEGSASGVARLMPNRLRLLVAISRIGSGILPVGRAYGTGSPTTNIMFQQQSEGDDSAKKIHSAL